MITEQNIEEMYSDYCYGIYYRKPTNWDRYYEAIVEKEDMEREDYKYD